MRLSSIEESSIGWSLVMLFMKQKMESLFCKKSIRFYAKLELIISDYSYGRFFTIVEFISFSEF